MYKIGRQIIFTKLRYLAIKIFCIYLLYRVFKMLKNIKMIINVDFFKTIFSKTLLKNPAIFRTSRGAVGYWKYNCSQMISISFWTSPLMSCWANHTILWILCFHIYAGSSKFPTCLVKVKWDIRVITQHIAMTIFMPFCHFHIVL